MKEEFGSTEALPAEKLCDHPGSEWQPIVTAPMDGTLIMLSTPLMGRPVIARWKRTIECWSPVSDMEASGTVDVDSYTHWMPLPAHPLR